MRRSLAGEASPCGLRFPAGSPAGVTLPVLTTPMREFVGSQRARVAADVAKMLVSDDPMTYQRAVETVAKDKALATLFKRAAGFGARALMSMAERASAQQERR